LRSIIQKCSRRKTSMSPTKHLASANKRFMFAATGHPTRKELRSLLTA
jgi:hypothetical protein